MTAPVHLVDIFEAHRTRTVEGLHTCEPGKVLSYNAAKQTADVQPVNKRRYEDADTGEIFFEDRPAVPNVPIAWTMAGGFGMCLPLDAGDHVWLVYAQESISEWREADQVSEPTDAGRLTDSHPFAIPAAFPVGKEFAQTTKAGAYFGHKGGNGLHVQASEAELKVGATTLGLKAAEAVLASAMIKLGTAPATGVATQQSQAPVMVALGAWIAAVNAAIQALVSPAGIADGLPTPPGPLRSTVATTTATVAPLLSNPASYATTVKAGP